MSPTYRSTVISLALILYLVTCITVTTEATSPNHPACQATDPGCNDETDGGIVTSNVAIQLHGEMYRLDVEPDVNSKVVAANRNRVVGDMNLYELMNDFRRIGTFITLAYNGVGAAGPKFTEIQLEIQDIGFGIANLFDSSALAVNELKTASEDVLSDLISMYDFLINNLEDIAFETLSDVLAVAKQMEETARKLQEKATKEQDKLISTLKKTQQAKGVEARSILEKQKEREEFERKKEEQEKHMIEALKKQREAENKLVEFEMKEEEAISSIGDMGVLKNMANFATSFVGVKAFSQEAHAQAAERKAKYWKDKLEEEKAIVSEYSKQRFMAQQQMIDCAMKIRNCEGEENMAEAAVDALHEAIGALKHIVVVMQRVIQFWKQVQHHCEFLASDKLRNKVKFAIENYSEEKRLKLWHANGFKVKIIRFYAGWVAVGKVCSDLVDHIKLTREDMYEMLEANPTYEECRKNVKDLATKFIHKIEEEKTIANKTEI